MIKYWNFFLYVTCFYGACLLNKTNGCFLTDFIEVINFVCSIVARRCLCWFLQFCLFTHKLVFEIYFKKTLSSNNRKKMSGLKLNPIIIFRHFPQLISVFAINDIQRVFAVFFIIRYSLDSLVVIGKNKVKIVIKQSCKSHENRVSAP